MLRLADHVRVAALAVVLAWPHAVAAADVGDGRNEPLLITADEMSHDSDLGITTARGNVEISRDDRVLLADTVIYNQRQDVVTASGNVSLLEPSGDVLFAEYMEMTGDFKDGIVQNIRILLSDRARIAATGARRSGGNRIEMNKAVYSPCEPCAEDPTRPPLWQVKAVRVLNDQTRQTMEYRDAWLEFMGVPVAYTPYFSHPDPTVRRRTGFLAPSYGGSSDFGFILKTPYFFDIAPDRDATVTPIFTGREGVALLGEYRQLLQRGKLTMVGSITEDSKDDIRGHVKGDGRFDIDDTWRWGFDAHRSTDDTYLRRYGYTSPNTLVSTAFVEGFRPRTYVSAAGQTYQGLRPDDDPGKTPIALPMVEYSHLGEADRLGGRGSLDASLLALSRTDGTDTRRFTARSGWDRPFYGPLGDVFLMSTSIEGDLYHTSTLVRPGKADSFTGAAWRLHPEASLGWRMPFVRDEGATYQLVEPIASAVVSPYGGNSSKIPNEDSHGFDFDDTNLFSPSRFPGHDRVEGGPRFSYGLKYGVYGRRGGSSSVFVGQSYRPKVDDTFARGSGLEDHFSDLVGSVYVAPGKYVSGEYRTRRSNENFEARRNELRLGVGQPALRLNLGYLFFDRQEGSEFPGREQVSATVGAQISRFWRGHVSAVDDLAANGGLRNLGLSLIYEDECFIFTTDVTRTFFTDRDIRPTDTILFRLTFKTLGEVHTSLAPGG